MAQDIDPFKLSSPRIFLVRMVVFLTLCALVAVVLYKQIWVAFLNNPGLNALIIGVLAIGIALAFRQVIRLFPEIDWVNGFRLADPGLAGAKVEEEAEEVVRAAREESDERVREEAADVLYHLDVLLAARGLSLTDAFEVLNGRRR